MSQTSLASAIRRRTKTEIVAKTTQGNIPIPPHKKNTSPTTSQSLNNSNVSISDTPATSPLMLLLQHKQLINKLENEVMELKESKSKNSNNPSEIEYYKKQYETLLNEFNEIKKVLVKVQTFSMETNLEILQLKRLLKQNNIDVSSNNLTGPDSSKLKYDVIDEANEEDEDDENSQNLENMENMENLENND